MERNDFTVSEHSRLLVQRDYLASALRSQMRVTAMVLLGWMATYAALLISRWHDSDGQRLAVLGGLFTVAGAVALWSARRKAARILEERPNG